MNIRTLAYGFTLALVGLSGCIVAPGHDGYQEGRRDEHRAEAAREQREADRERQERHEEHLDRYCEDPYNRTHDDRCR